MCAINNKRGPSLPSSSCGMHKLCLLNKLHVLADFAAEVVKDISKYIYMDTGCDTELEWSGSVFMANTYLDSQ